MVIHGSKKTHTWNKGALGDVPRLCHHGRRLGEQRHLMVRVVRPSVSDVVEDVGSRQLVPFRDGHQSLWSEGSFCVNVEALAFSASLINGQL